MLLLHPLNRVLTMFNCWHVLPKRVVIFFQVRICNVKHNIYSNYDKIVHHEFSHVPKFCNQLIWFTRFCCTFNAPSDIWILKSRRH